MALNASKVETTGAKRAPALEPGTYPARVVQIISLGVQEQRAFKGKEKPPKDELYVTYELLDEYLLDEDGKEREDKPRWISERFPLNHIDSDLATSTKRYFALDPTKEYGGDWSKLESTPCMVTVTNYKNKDGEVRDTVDSVSTMRAKEASKAKELVNPPKVFDIDSPDMEIFGSLPQWLQDTMTKNLNYEGSALEKAMKNFKKEGSSKEKEEQEDQVEESNDEEDEEEEDW